jgi:hypothetical protein
MKFNVQAVEGTRVVAIGTADTLDEALRLFAEKIELVMRQHDKASDDAYRAKLVALKVRS